MTSGQLFLLIKCRIPGCILLCHKILCRLVSLILQRTADDLFDFSVVYINAWPKSHILMLLFFFRQYTAVRFY